MDNRPIGVFDSGLGGLTVVKELERLMPNEDIVYFGDTGRVPYGTRGHDTIKKYALQDIRFLHSFDVKYIIIACGTVSTVAYKEAAASTSIPVAGVVSPTAAAAAAAAANGRIGVIATSASIGSGAYEKAIKCIKPEAVVKSRACPLFVPLVENGCFMVGNKIAELTAHEYLDDLRCLNLDTLILGCTHYPLLSKVISGILPGVTLINPGSATVRAIVPQLEKAGLMSGKNQKGETRFYVSDCAGDFERLAGIFLEHEVSGCAEKIDIEKY